MFEEETHQDWVSSSNQLGLIEDTVQHVHPGVPYIPIYSDIKQSAKPVMVSPSCMYCISYILLMLTHSHTTCNIFENFHVSLNALL